MRLAIITAGLLLFTGCRDSLSEPQPQTLHTGDVAASLLTRDAKLAFQTDSLHYAVVFTETAFQAKLTVTFTNPFAVPVYFRNCQGDTFHHVEKWEGGEWVPLYGSVRRDCLSPPIEVRPGASHVFRTGVLWGLPNSNWASRIDPTRIDGVHRVVFDDMFMTTRGGSRPIAAPALEFRTSNRFTLRHVVP